MECAAALFSCYNGACFGDENASERVENARNPCPQQFKLKTLLVHIASHKSVLRLESTNCKIACLPTGLVKKIVFLYLKGRYENLLSQTDITDSENDDEDEENSADSGHLANVSSFLTSSSISSSMHSMHEAYAANRGQTDVEGSGVSNGGGGNGNAGSNLKVLQDTYILTFRKGAAAKEKEHVQVKLFMVNASPLHDTPAKDMKIVHVLLRDNLWVDIVVSEIAAPFSPMPINPDEVDEVDMVFQVYRCDECGDFNACTCSRSPPQTIWRREEDIRLDECVVRKKRNGEYVWDDHLQNYPTLHKCSASCESSVGVLHLFLVPSSQAHDAEFDLTISSSKKVQDLSDQVYTMFCVTVCHGELKWHITRRFRDFAQMHSNLIKEVGQLPADFPSLPPKTWFAPTDVQFIQTRQLQLETYLRRMAQRPDVVQTVSFLSFLGAMSSPRLEHEWISGVPRDVIHLRILHRYVELGDILLFQSKNSMSGVQRTMTGAEWDHVAMVVEAPKSSRSSKFLLLEATGDGVTAFPLVSRILAYNSCFINYIALRKLRMAPNYRETFRQRLSDFVAKVEGKPYSMTLTKFVHSTETNADLTGFFCSELIAAAFKASGLIGDEYPASSFWPGSFGSGGEVDRELAQHDAYLEREVVIDCRVLEIALANKEQHGVGTVVHHQP